MINPRTTAGAELLTCDLDATCARLDCASLLEEYGETLGASSAGVEFVAHYCGLEYVGLLPTKPLAEAEEYS